MTSPRIVYSVRFAPGGGQDPWCILEDGKPLAVSFYTKAEAVREARAIAKRRAGVDRTVTQLRVFNKDGRIAFEATYPRSSDPRRYAS